MYTSIRSAPNKIRALLAQEFVRWPLWLPVGVGIGIALYFSAPTEPGIGIIAGIVSLWVATFWAWRMHWKAVPMLCVFAIAGFGFALATLHTDRNHTVMLHKAQKPQTLTGRIVEIAEEPGALRLTLDSVSSEKEGVEPVPERIRVKLRGDLPILLSGDWIKFRAGLLPPTGPVQPGGFDFARFFFFREIGAVGYVLPPVERLPHEETGYFESLFMDWLELRRALTHRIREQMEPEAGAVAAALMTGDRAGILEAVNESMRKTNLSHLLAISGMHMAMVTGMVFFLVRLVLVLVPWTQHARHNKQWAAALGLVSGLAYLLIAGVPISAARAYVMVALLLSAIILERQVMPMRSLALAALLLLVYDPSNLLEPGFQLSFAATLALIAFYEQMRGFIDYGQWRERLSGRLLVWVGGILATTLAAELATAPLLLYHFNNLSLYGMLANLLVMPLISFVIMPAMLAGFILMPFGAEAWAMRVMEWGITQMLALAEWTAALPHASFFIPTLPGWGLALMILGGLLFLLLQTQLRFSGILFLLAGIGSYAFVSIPDLMIGPEGKAIAVREPEGLVLLKGRSYSFIPELWAHGAGQEQLAVRKPVSEGPYRCDISGCAYEMGGHYIALPKHMHALKQDCERADIVVAAFYVRPWECKGARIIDRGLLERNGAQWFWFEGDTIRSESAGMLQGRRPWR